MSVKQDLLPRLSQATNAYDLLNDVIAAIEAEPKRMDMSTWISKEGEDYTKTKSYGPQCGTVACIAGWGTILTVDPNLPLQVWNAQVDLPSITMRQILTPPEWFYQSGVKNLGKEETKIANEFRQDVRNLFMYQPSEDYGTAEYVAVVVAHIRAFQEKHADILKRQTLPLSTRYDVDSEERVV